MSSDFDQDGLISIFVLEASDGLKTLWNTLTPSDGSLPSADALRAQFILAHRIKGAAYQYEFTEIARLGEELEQTLEHIDTADEHDLERMVLQMRDLVVQMQREVERVGARPPAEPAAEPPAPTGPEPGRTDAPLADGASPVEPPGLPALTDDYLIPDIHEEVLEYFAPEARGYLDTLETELLRLEKDPRDTTTIQTLFRTAHTLKGSAYTVGCDVIGDVAHPLEDLMGVMRETHVEATPTQLDLIFRAIDVMRLLMLRDPSLLAQMREKTATLLDDLRQDIQVHQATAEPPAEDIPPVADAPRSTGALEPPADDVMEPPLRLVEDELPAPEAPPAEAAAPPFDEEPPAAAVDETDAVLTSMESILARLESQEDQDQAWQDLLDATRRLQDLAETEGQAALGEFARQLGGILDQLPQGGLAPDLLDVLARALHTYRLMARLGRSKGEEADATMAAVLEGLRAASTTSVPTGPEPEAGAHRPSRPDAPATAQAGSGGIAADESLVVRVSQERLERLLNLVGELVIGRGRLDQRLTTLQQLSDQLMAYRSRMLDSVRSFENKHEFTLPSDSAGAIDLDGLDNPALADFGSLEFDKYDDFNILSRRIAEVAADVSESMSQLNTSIRQAREDMSQLQRLTTTIRNEIAHTRMVPIGTPFLRFRRAVRELARSTGKEVALVTSGEQTDVDSTIVDRLVDPLIHMVRNAVYHGIEPPDVRRAKGKPAMGTVSLRASHHGNRVLIEVEDDGAGLNVDRIKTRALELGLIDPRTADLLSREEIINLIFLPKMSTAESVGQTAGRGIGMDVVRQTIESMNGHIAVETEPGRYTRFVLELPLTLLVSTALLVRVGDHRYAIPLPSVREVVQPLSGELQTTGGRTILQLADENIEVESLAHFLHDDPPGVAEHLPIVIARTPSGPLGLTVDELLGRQEIVIKSLGTLKPLQKAAFGGATIDPEGRVILVLDVARLTVRPALGFDPAARAATELLGTGSHLEEDPAEATGKLPILLIDDSLSIRKFVGRMLEKAGYRVDTAVDGEEGLRKVMATRYGLVITDLEMPKVNGYEVLQALRNRTQTQAIPVIVMTTRAGEKHRHIALNMGASSYIAKPVEERALIAEVGRWVGQEAGASR